ncbi:MAG: dihydroorotate dehydrogenase electron transfer subunit [Bacillota bacterium]|jgi:dihydroorotate dehydrogenase electron transfer subunit
MMIEKCLIIENRQLFPHFYQMDLEAQHIASKALPGQFIMVKTGQNYDPFLKRPMCISLIDQERGRISYIYQVKGRGTALLSEIVAGAALEISGPIGNGWHIDGASEKVLLVGGGVGITPLLPLAECLHARHIKSHILLGAAHKGQLFGYDRLRYLGNLQVTTEDGSQGQQGNVTMLLPPKPAFDMVYCCGPRALMAAVAAWAHQYDLPCQVSLEERMGCGIGTCMGCVCMTKAADEKLSYKRICCDGPVFDSREVFF